MLSFLSGGNLVNHIQVSLFQCCLGVASIIIFILMKRLNRNLSSPTSEPELLGWKLDIAYSMGMALTFFLSMYLKKTPLAFITPYFDQIVAVLVMVFALPESIKVLWKAIKDIFLSSPNKVYLDEVKSIFYPVLEEYQFHPVFFDITKTGRHLWIAVYFRVETETLEIASLAKASASVNEKTKNKFQECTCELILIP